MKLFEKEASVLVGILTALLGLLFVYKVLTEEQVAAWGVFVVACSPVLSGFVARFFVWSTNTIKQAGFNPEFVQKRADDPLVTKFEAAD